MVMSYKEFLKIFSKTKCWKDITNSAKLKWNSNAPVLIKDKNLELWHVFIRIKKTTVSCSATVRHKFCGRISKNFGKIFREFLRNFLEFLRKFLGYFLPKRKFQRIFVLDFTPTVDKLSFSALPRNPNWIYSSNWSTFRTIYLKYCSLST